jgi:hypothetical protein
MTFFLGVFAPLREAKLSILAPRHKDAKGAKK